MSKPLLIVVTGAPATGKTTIGRRIAWEFCLPFVNKDGIKETLFDSLGWGDRAWSRRLGAASVELLYFFTRATLAVGRSLVVESNFVSRLATGEFRALKRRYPFEPFQVVCRADAKTLARRYRERADSGERHPGHLDTILAQELDPEALTIKHASIALGGQVVQVDTSDFKAVDYGHLFGMVRSALDGVRVTRSAS